MSILKKITLFALLWGVSFSTKAQTITDFVRIIDTEFEPYRDGEMSATDSLTDIQNGYYERSMNGDANRQQVLRQVIVLNNEDRSHTLVERISYYNGACMSHLLKFYRSTGQDFTFYTDNEYLIPFIHEEEMLTPAALRVFQKHFTESAHRYYPSLRAFISSAYEAIRYELPRYGTSIIAHLDFCDQFGENLTISTEELNIIKQGTIPLTLSYDRKYKQFVK